MKKRDFGLVTEGHLNHEYTLKVHYVNLIEMSTLKTQLTAMKFCAYSLFLKFFILLWVYIRPISPMMRIPSIQVAKKKVE